MADNDQDGSEAPAPKVLIGRLRRELGTLESYAALLAGVIGAGIFTVTSRAWTLTGPSMILGYVLLLPVILATSVAYAAFLSTPLGREPGGEYTTSRGHSADTASPSSGRGRVYHSPRQLQSVENTASSFAERDSDCRLNIRLRFIDSEIPAGPPTTKA